MSPHGGRRARAGRKPTGVPPRRAIQVLLTEAERAEIETAAMFDERETSTWMREASLAKARRKRS